MLDTVFPDSVATPTPVEAPETVPVTFVDSSTPPAPPAE